MIDNDYCGKVRCILRESSNTDFLDQSDLNLEKIVGDLNDEEFIAQAAVGVDAIMHIYNIHHSRSIVKVAIESGVKRVILIHTTGVYSKYKEAAQEYIEIEKDIKSLTKAAGGSITITILRPTMIYGDMCDRNMSRFILMIDKHRIIPVINHGSSLIQPVNARDLGKAYYSVLMSPKETNGKAYNLSGDKPIRIIDVFKIINKELGSKTMFISIPLVIGILLARIIKFVTASKLIM